MANQNSSTNHRQLLLRPPEVAAMLGISRALGYRWAQNGILPVIRVGRSVRIPQDALSEWIATRTKPPTA